MLHVLEVPYRSRLMLKLQQFITTLQVNHRLEAKLTRLRSLLVRIAGVQVFKARIRPNDTL